MKNECLDDKLIKKTPLSIETPDNHINLKHLSELCTLSANL